MEPVDDEVEALAQDLFRRADPTGLWSNADYIIQEYFRREAARKLQQRYTANQQFLIDESR